MSIERAASLVAAARENDAEAFVVEEERRSRRWRDGILVHDHAGQVRGAAVRLRMGGRVGLAAGAGIIDPPDLIARARGASEIGPEVPRGFASPALGQRTSPQPPPDTVTAEAVDLLCTRIRSAHSDVTVIVDVEERESDRAIATRTGAVDDHTRATLITVAASRVGVGEILDIVRRVPWLGDERHLLALADSLVERLQWSRREAPAAAGDLAVVLTPEALGALIVFPLAGALSGTALVDGTSPLPNSLGTEIGGDWVTILDDPTLPGAPRSRAVDDEGLPARPRALVRTGTVEHYLLDLSSADRLGLLSGGSAWRAWDTWPEPGPSTLVVPEGQRSLQDILNSFPRALLVEELSAEWLADTGAGTIAATLGLAYLFGNGEPVGRVREGALHAALGALLAGRVELSRERSWVDARGVLPYAHADALSVDLAGD